MRAVRFLIPFLLAGACIDPFDIKLAGNPKILVVDGLISDQPGPYTVKLSQSLALNDELDETNWVQGAMVTIFDDQGNTETLTEVSPGIHQTSTTQGVIGRSYHIQVKTPDGAIYTSAPDKLLPVGDFTNLRYEFVQNESVLTNDPLNSKNGFNIYVDANVLPEQNGLVRWRWTGTFHLLTYPKLRVKAVSTPTGGTLILPDPPPCSGYAFFFGALYHFGDCTCCDCWVTQYNDLPLLSDKTFISGDQVKNFNVAFIQANRRYLYEKYYLAVDQLSTSAVAYTFWQEVLRQRQSGSDLFQTPPAPTIGNITTTTPGALVTGLFVAASIKQHVIVIDRSELPADYYLPPIDTIKSSCSLVYPNSSTTKPAFY